MKSRHQQDQLALPPMPVGKSERASTSFRTSEQPAEAFGTSEHDAATLLDEAFTAAQLENKEIAHLCGVSQSLVEKWRKSDQRGSPSFVQLLMLPPRFHIELHRALDRRYGFGRAALQRLLEAVGTLALAVER